MFLHLSVRFTPFPSSSEGVFLVILHIIKKNYRAILFIPFLSSFGMKSLLGTFGIQLAFGLSFISQGPSLEGPTLL